MSRQSADALHAEAEEFADRAWTEDFAVHPGAFLGWIRLLVLIYLAGVVLLWLSVHHSLAMCWKPLARRRSLQPLRWQATWGVNWIKA